MKTKHWLLLIFLLLLLAAAGTAWYLHRKIYQPNTAFAGNDSIVYLATGADWDEVQRSLAPVFERPEDFFWVAAQKDLAQSWRPGRYRIPAGASSNQVVNMLRSGAQAPLMLRLNQINGYPKLAGRLAQYLEPDSLSFLHFFAQAENWQPYDLEPEKGLAIFLANSYEFYWNTSPEAVLERFWREWQKFWTKEREDQRSALGLTRVEVITLASIVESETAQADEMPRVAGLYLNRLARGMKLQSDPTVIHAIQRDDPERIIRRVLYRDLTYDSPYNTYRYAGLPPAPLRCPAPSAIEAVLAAEKHPYIFMAADPERPGYHSFARNLSEHGRNRQKYIQWINRQGIRR